MRSSHHPACPTTARQDSDAHVPLLPRSPKGIANYRMSFLIKDLASVIRTVSPDRKVVLVAHDWGGIGAAAAVA